MAIHNILKNLIACINRILGNNTEPPHITQIISTFDTMFHSELHDATPTLQEAKTILKKAFDEGEKHIGKKDEDIHSLTETWINCQDFKNIMFDDAIFVAFLTGASQHGKNNH